MKAGSESRTGLVDSPGEPEHLLLVELLPGEPGGYPWAVALEEGGGKIIGEVFVWPRAWLIPWPSQSADAGP